MRVPFLDLDAMHRPIRAELDSCWARAVESSSFIGGETVAAFERAFADACGVAHCVGVANGTDALELALAAHGIGPGDDVIIPANTFVATAEAVCNVGARVVFADVDPSTLLVDADRVEAVRTPATAAIIAVHLYGQPVDGRALRTYADGRGLLLVEDAAQAHGARHDGTTVGGFGHVAAFSFYPGKNLGAFGDGGAVVTDDGMVAGRVRAIANHGRAASCAHVHAAGGRNSRLDALQAAILSTKLVHLERWNAARRSVHERYARRLAGSQAALVAVDPRADAVHHLEVVRVPNRSAVMRALTGAEIGFGVHYPTPCHRHEAFAATDAPAMPVTEAAAAEILSLPMFPTMSADQVDHVCDVVLAAVTRA